LNNGIQKAAPWSPALETRTASQADIWNQCQSERLQRLGSAPQARGNQHPWQSKVSVVRSMCTCCTWKKRSCQSWRKGRLVTTAPTGWASHLFQRRAVSLLSPIFRAPNSSISL